MPDIFFKRFYLALAGVAQWIECQPVNQRALPVQFPVRLHAWVAGQVLGGGAHKK